ncbi:MAG: transcription antitermination factor NusB [Clostridia bacterium]|nr:transcription antitermination factor NusB [Clostridia bacterium]
MNRKKAREYAFILLFEYKFQPEEIERILSDFIEEYNPGDQQEYIEKVVRGVVSNKEGIDKKIDELSQGWKAERISNVSLAVLRLAAFEIEFCDDIPAVVSVNEAVSLAKKYDGDEAAPFVNGILGKLSGMTGVKK